MLRCPCVQRGAARHRIHIRMQSHDQHHDQAPRLPRMSGNRRLLPHTSRTKLCTGPASRRSPSAQKARTDRLELPAAAPMPIEKLTGPGEVTHGRQPPASGTPTTETTTPTSSISNKVLPSTRGDTASQMLPIFRLRRAPPSTPRPAKAPGEQRHGKRKSKTAPAVGWRGTVYSRQIANLMKKSD